MRDRRSILVLYVLRGWPPEQEKRKALILAEVFAIAVTGVVRKFEGPELSRFKFKALLDSGLLPRPVVALAQLPLDAPRSASATWDMVGELLEVRVAKGEKGAYEPFPFSAPWIAAMNGTNEAVVRAGKTWLWRHGYLTRAGEGPGRFGRPTFHWRARLDP